MQTITVSTEIYAPLERVWKFFTEPQHIIRWNAASEDWETTSATNELQVGGKFCFHMTAKEKTFGFDFAGEYDEVHPLQNLRYTLADQRKVSTTFFAKNDVVTIVQSFEAEKTHPEEQQHQGWQAILNNFKKYVEQQV